MSDGKESNSAAQSGGIGAASLLGVLFVGLKLTGHLDWSWFWVTMPFWGPAAFILGLALIIALVCLVIEAVKG